MTGTTAPYRIASIDILRGLVMIIMALDHTRDFFHSTALTDDPLDASTTTPALFFTRWITHYCAPIFVFLSGLSAYLSSRSKTKGQTSGFLIKRGLWLILVEITLVTFGITFNPFFNFVILQVIWAIGCSMVILGLLIGISNQVVLTAGIVLFFGHNIVDYLHLPQNGVVGNLWTIFLTSSGRVIPIDSTHMIGVFYAILPWTGVMLMGYSMGKWFQKDFPAEKRRRFLLITGSSLILLFIVLRFLKGYGNPGGWDGKNLYTFLDTSKYPPSLQYGCMTLGPGLIFLALAENVRARWGRFVSVYGRVPFFYYILHFYLIHTLTGIVFFATGHTFGQISDPQSIFLFRPVNFGFDLWIVYFVWISIVALLYLPCRWFNKYKMQHSQWWLRYV